MTLLGITSIGAAALVVALGATQLLPRHITVERSAQVPMTPTEFVTLASSTEGFQTFNPYRTADADLKITPFGPATGVGSGFAFDGKDGKGTQTVAQITDTSVTYDIDLGPMGQPTQSLAASPSAGGSTVTWSMQADMGRNPIARIMGLFMDGMIGKTFEQGLTNLQSNA